MPARPSSSLTFVALPMLAMLLLVGLLYTLTVWRVAERLEERSALRLEQRAQVLAERLSAELRARAAALELLARAEGLAATAPPQRVRDELDWLRARSPGLVWMGFTDADGVVRVASEGWLEGESIAARPVFLEARERTMIGSFHPPLRLAADLARAGRGTSAVADLGVPLRDADGRLRGVLVAHVDAAALLLLGDEHLGEAERRRLGLSWHLVGSTGEVLGAPPPLPLPPSDTAAPRPAQMLGDGDGRWLVASHPMVWSSPAEAGRWQVVLAQREAALMQPLRELERSLAWFAALALMTAGLFGLAAARRVVRPIDSLLAALAASMPGAAVADEGRENFGGYLRRLQSALPAQPEGGGRDSEAQLVWRLARDAERLQRVVDALPVGVALLSRRGRIEDSNAPLRRLLGSAVDGETFAERIVEAAPRATVAWHFESAEGDGAEGLAGLTQCSLRHADGHAVPVALQWLALPAARTEATPGGRADATLLVVQDLSAQTRAAAQAASLSARLAAFADAALDYAFVTLDAEAHVLDWSPGAVALTGRSPTQQQGLAFAALFDGAEQAVGLPARLLAEARAGRRARLLARLQRATGDSFVAEGALYAFQAGDGATAYALVFSDATRAQAAARRIAESEERLAAVIGSASDAIISTDAEGRVQLFNPAAERIFRRPAAALLGQPLDLLLPSGHGPAHLRSLAGFAASQVTRRPMGVGRVQGLRADGAVLELEASIARAVVGGQTVLTAILRDVTERIRAERALVEYQLQLAGLTQRLLEQEKQTTQRLAQALHDDLGQTLAAQRWLCEAAQAREALPPWAQKLHTLVLQANQQVRRVLTELRPPLLDEQGLLAALDNELAERRALLADARPVLVLDGTAFAEGRRWPADVEYAAFMVAREAVGNALRHAAADEVRVVLQGDAAGLHLRVQDDGRGAAALPEALHPGHLGLVGMRERALAIGATLQIRSSETEGTTIELVWRGGSERIGP